jgi:cytoskeletal protein CcmA (bactofilin family)
VRKNLKVILSAALLIGLSLIGYKSNAQTEFFGGEVVTEGEPIEDDHFTAGGSVTILSPVMGDLFAAGGNIVLKGPVEGDLFACGGSVLSTGDIQEDARLAGGQIRIGGSIRRNASAFGGTVVLEKDGEVGRDLNVGCGELTIAGLIKRDLEGSADQVVISGTIEGDAKIDAGKITLMPTAQILGDLSYSSSKEADIQEGAFIQGEITHRKSKASKEKRGGMGTFTILLKLLSIISLFLFGIFLILLSPKMANRAASNIRSSPWKSLGIGLLLLLVVPAVVGALAITLVGIPLALVLLVTYLIFLYISKIYTGLFLGLIIVKGAGQEKKGKMIGALLLGLAVLTILTSIPFVGKIFLIIAVLFGLGAFVVERVRLYKEAKEKGMV